MATKTFEAQSAVDTTLVTTAETVVATVAGVSTPRKTNVVIEAWAQITTGATTTSLVPRIRRGVDATGVLVGEGNPQTLQAAAGGTEQIDIKVIDPGVDLSNGTYVMTVVQTAATANGSCLQSSITASCPD